MNDDEQFLCHMATISQSDGGIRDEATVLLTPPGPDGLWVASVMFGPFYAKVARYHGPTAVAAVFEELTRVMRDRVVMRHGKPVVP